jgi:hypothetical protein
VIGSTRGSVTATFAFICVYLRQKFFSSWSPSPSQMHPEKAQALRARTRRQNRPNHAIQTIPY